MNIRTRRAGTPPGRLQSRLRSGERTGVRESIYESEIQESRKDCQTNAGCFAIFDTDTLQFLERLTELIKNVARQ